MTPEPDRYSHGHDESVLRSHRWRTAENSAAFLLPHLAPGMSILDVGCGPGTISLDLARRVYPGPVLGIDLADDVVDAARHDCDGAAGAHLEFAVGDVYSLDADDASFDVDLGVLKAMAAIHRDDHEAARSILRDVVRHLDILSRSSLRTYVIRLLDLLLLGRFEMALKSATISAAEALSPSIPPYDCSKAMLAAKEMGCERENSERSNPARMSTPLEWMAPLNSTSRSILMIPELPALTVVVIRAGLPKLTIPVL